MKTLITLFAILSLTLIAAAQPPDTLWTRTFGGSGDDEGYSVQQTTDGGYVIAGLTNSYGAGNADVYLIKTDASGNLVWQRTFGGSNGDLGNSVQQTSDGGYVIAGTTYSYGAGSADVYLIKTDANGDSVWTRTFGGIYNDEGYSARQTSDGGYIIAGTNGNVYLIKTDAEGNLAWQRSYAYSIWDEGRCVKQTTDGGYIVAGYTSIEFGNMDVYVFKTDINGNLVWQRTFGGNFWDVSYSVLQTTDNGYIIAGLTNSYGIGGEDVYLIKTDTNGNQVWTRTLGGHEEDGSYCIQPTSDGGYIISGFTESFGANWSNVYMIKIDVEGNLIWQRTFGGSSDDVGNSVQQTSDGGYIIAGYTWSFGAGDYDVYLIKTDAGGVPPTLDINISAVNPPIIIPRNGGSFQYNINVHNLITSPQTISVWNKIRAGNTYYSVFGPITRTIGGGANITRVLMQTIAATIPSGTLDFISYIGTYPSAIVDSSYFTITKLATEDGGPWIAESKVIGDCFEEYEDVGVGAHGVRPSGSGATPTTEVMPNPFNPTTAIRFDLPEAAGVTLEVFDINGRLVGQPSVVASAGGRQGRLPHRQWFTAGTHEITFDRSDLPSGVYIYHLEAGGATAIGKMVLLK